MLRTFLPSTTGIVLLIVVVFALPLVATAIVLAFTMLLSPAVWIAGSSYAARGNQAFFRGGLIAGILPFVVASGVALTLGMGGFFSPIYSPAPTRIFRNTAVGVSPAAPAMAGELAAPSDPSAVTPDVPMLDSTLDDPLPAVTAPATVLVIATDRRSPNRSASPQSYAETLSMRLTMAILWLAPGVFAFLGGGLSYLTFRLVSPHQTHLAAIAGNARNATFTTHARDVNGSVLPEQNVDRVASERG